MKESPSSTSRPLGVLALIALALILIAAFLKFLGALGSSGIIMLAAVLVAYLILPVVHRLRRFMPLWAAVLATYLIFAAFIALAVVIIVPPLAAQERGLVASLPGLINRLTAELSDPHNPLIAKLPNELRSYLVGLPARAIATVSRYGIVVARGVFGVLLSTVSLLLSLIIVPVLAAYLFFETHEVKRAAIGLVPPRARVKTLAIVSDLSDAIGAFVRGQVLDGLVVGVLIALMLYFMRVPYALLIGVAAGVLNLVPYLGAIAGFVPAVLLALGYNGWENAVAVAILFGVIQQIDGTFILPRIMKQNVQLSPVIIIVSILIATGLFGILGTFLAVPVAAMLRVIKLHFAPAPPDLEMTALESGAKALTVFH